MNNLNKIEKIIHWGLMIGAGFALYNSRIDLAIFIYLVIIQDHLVTIIRK
jgi:hypothetical protein